jgi:hypothetical protein
MVVNSDSSRNGPRRSSALDRSPTPEAIADRVFENNLAVLIGNLEYLRSLMEAALARQRPEEVLESAATLVTQVVGFADKYPAADGADDRSTADRAAAAFFTAVRRAEEQLTPSVMKSLLGWLGATAARSAEYRSAAAEVAPAADRALEAFFDSFAERLGRADALTRWRETTAVFRADLRRVLDGLA